MEVRERQGEAKGKWEMRRKDVYERDGMSVREVEDKWVIEQSREKRNAERNS